MTAQNNLRVRWVMAATIAMISLVSASAAAQDAKALYAQALVEGSSCKKMLLACQASRLDPKKKEYSDTCDSFRAPITHSDEVQKGKALDAINRGDLAAATRITNLLVCTTDTKQLLLSQIDDAKKASQPVQQAAVPPPPAAKADQSSLFLAEANQAFGEGHLDAAASAAGKVTDSNLKPIADGIAGRVNAYRSAVAAARASEAGKDYAGALSNWRTAQGISGNGPDSPASNISRLEPLARPAAAPTQVAANTPPPPAPTPTKKTEPNKPAPPVDNTAEIARLLDAAGKAERSNDLQAALHAYEGVLRLQATNSIAFVGKAGVQAKINSDPAEQAKALAQAIRYFYGSKYPDAEDALRSYLDAPTAKSKGAAYFYLGATRLYEKILSASGTKAETLMASSEIQRPFKDARMAGYQPVERFVSPVVLRAWRSVQ